MQPLWHQHGRCGIDAATAVSTRPLRYRGAHCGVGTAAAASTLPLQHRRDPARGKPKNVVWRIRDHVLATPEAWFDQGSATQGAWRGESKSTVQPERKHRKNGPKTSKKAFSNIFKCFLRKRAPIHVRDPFGIRWGSVRPTFGPKFPEPNF